MRQLFVLGLLSRVIRVETLPGSWTSSGVYNTATSVVLTIIQGSGGPNHSRSLEQGHKVS